MEGAAGHEGDPVVVAKAFASYIEAFCCLQGQQFGLTADEFIPFPGAMPPHCKAEQPCGCYHWTRKAP